MKYLNIQPHEYPENNVSDYIPVIICPECNNILNSDVDSVKPFIEYERRSVTLNKVVKAKCRCSICDTKFDICNNIESKIQIKGLCFLISSLILIFSFFSSILFALTYIAFKIKLLAKFSIILLMISFIFSIVTAVFNDYDD